MSIWQKWNSISLINRIILGLILGIVIALIFGNTASGISILGSLFVSALRAVAPILVFFLLISAIASHKSSSGELKSARKIVSLYLVGTFLASLTAVVASFIFPCFYIFSCSRKQYKSTIWNS